MTLPLALFGAACGETGADSVPVQGDARPAAGSEAGAPEREIAEPVLRCGYSARLRGDVDPDCDSIRRPLPPGSVTTGSERAPDSDRSQSPSTGDAR